MTAMLTFRRLAVGVSGVLAASVLPGVGATTAYAAGAPTTRAFVTADHHVQMPTRLTPGMRRLVVRSAKAADIQIVKPRAGYTKREFARDVNRMWERPRVLRRAERNVHLIGGVTSRPDQPGVMWARLTVGRYWVIDVDANRTLASKMLTVRVGGERGGGVLPSGPTLRAINAVDFAAAPKSIPESGRLTLRNNSSENHFFSAARLKKGKTVADFREWVEKLMNGNETPAPVRWNVGFDSGVMGPGRAMTMKYDVPRGRYVLMCWWPDADMDNMPHVFMGMFRGLRVR